MAVYNYDKVYDWYVNGQYYYELTSPPSSLPGNSNLMFRFPGSMTGDSLRLRLYPDTSGSNTIYINARKDLGAYSMGYDQAITFTANTWTDSVVPAEIDAVLRASGDTYLGFSTFSGSVSLSGSYKFHIEGISLSSIRVNVGGTWRAGKPYVNVNGVWKEGEAWVNVGGVWKKGG